MFRFFLASVIVAVLVGCGGGGGGDKAPSIDSKLVGNWKGGCRSLSSESVIMSHRFSANGSYTREMWIYDGARSYCSESALSMHAKTSGTFKSAGTKTTESGVIANIIKIIGDEEISTVYAGHAFANSMGITEDTVLDYESDIDKYDIYLIDDGDTLYFGVYDDIMDGSTLDRTANRLLFDFPFTKQ